jgi:hypothetical protein
MTTDQETMTRLRWPAEVEEFAAQRGLADYLPQVWQMTRQVFPQAQQLAFRLEEDVEIPDDWRVIVHVEAPLTVPQLVAGQRQWYDGLFALCPAPQAVWFCLTLYPVA